MGIRPVVRMMLALWLLLSSVAFAETAGEADAGQRVTLANLLLQQSGTASVFDSQAIQRALADPAMLRASFGRGFDGKRVQGVLREAGFRVWAERPRLWVLEQTPDGFQPLAGQAAFAEQAAFRGLPVSGASASADRESIQSLLAGGPEVGLPALLEARQADALVWVKTAANAVEWQFIQPGHRLKGRFQTRDDWQALLPHVLAEVLAAGFQWPEAYGRPLLRVSGVDSLQQFAAVQQALQRIDGLQNVSLVRLDGSRAYFAVDPMPAEAFRAAVAKEPRLLADAPVVEAQAGLIQQGLRFGSPLLTRAWAAQPAAL